MAKLKEMAPHLDGDEDGQGMNWIGNNIIYSRSVIENDFETRTTFSLLWDYLWDNFFLQAHHI